MDIVKIAGTAAKRNALKTLRSTGKLPSWFTMKNPAYAKLQMARNSLFNRADKLTQLERNIKKKRRELIDRIDDTLGQSNFTFKVLPRSFTSLTGGPDINKLAQRYANMLNRRTFVNPFKRSKRGTLLLDTLIKGKNPELGDIFRLKNEQMRLTRHIDKLQRLRDINKGHTYQISEKLGRTPIIPPWAHGQRTKPRNSVYPDNTRPTLPSSYFKNDPNSVWKGTHYRSTFNQYLTDPSAPMWASPRVDVGLNYAKRNGRGTLIQFDRNKLKDIDDRTGQAVAPINSTHMADPSYRLRLEKGQGGINRGHWNWGLDPNYQTVFIPRVSAPWKQAVKNIYTQDKHIPGNWRYVRSVQHPRYSALQRQIRERGLY